MAARPRIEDGAVQAGLGDLARALEAEIGRKGRGAFASGHEILGVLQEEVQEYAAEVHRNGDAEAKRRELLDVAIAALWGYLSFGAGVDW